MKFFMGLLLFVLLAHSPGFAASSSYPFGQGVVELVSSHDFWSETQKLSLGVYFKLSKGWHIYWKNSGDSGAAPKWTWKIQGAQLGTEQWPVPERIPIESLVNFGYEKDPLFQFELIPENNPQKIIADLKLEFLVCKIECIPYFAELHKEITYSAKTGALKKIFTSQTYPQTAPPELKWQILERKSDSLVTTLTLPPSLAQNIKTLEIFPEDGVSFKAQSPEIEPQDAQYRVTFALQDTSKNDFRGSKILMVLVDTKKNQLAYEAELTSSGAGPNMALILLWAVLGGLILNVMPCVFPVLSIKVLSFLGPEKNERQLRKSGVFYTLGVLASFFILGGTLLALRASGEQIGWGFQLQSPVIAAGIAVLFFWLGLNFLGSFEIGQSLTYLGARKTGNNHWGSFFTGVLATVVATPCTAPFMGAALGASLTLTPALTLLVFLGLGFGMALPFLVFAYFPQGLRYLPKPGAWMQTVKEFLAFPLFATVIWLLWVLSQQTQTETLMYVLSIFLLVGLWVWICHGIKNERWKQALLVLGFLGSMGLLKMLPTEKPSAVTSTTSAWKEFQETQIQEDLKAGQAVFIDFTAAWCITCQVNKKLVLNTDEIQNAFSHNKVKLYKADWTDKNPKITAALERFGRNSLPVYVYYPAGSQKPTLLPEILTSGIILDLFNNKEKTP